MQLEDKTALSILLFLCAGAFVYEWLSIHFRMKEQVTAGSVSVCTYPFEQWLSVVYPAASSLERFCSNTNVDMVPP